MRSWRSEADAAERAHVVQRSASLTMMTRISFTIASSILRKLSAWRSSAEKKVELAQLGDAVHAARHFVAELLADLLDGDAGVFHHVVQQAGFRQTRSIRMSARMSATCSG